MSLPPALITRYRALLPVTDDTPVISLGEGGTPLVPLERLGGATASSSSPSSRG